jgi:hypothetical protein
LTSDRLERTQVCWVKLFRDFQGPGCVDGYGFRSNGGNMSLAFCAGLSSGLWVKRPHHLRRGIERQENKRGQHGRHCFPSAPVLFWKRVFYFPGSAKFGPAAVKRLEVRDATGRGICSPSFKCELEPDERRSWLKMRIWAIRIG